MFCRMVLLISVVSLAVLTVSCETKVESKHQTFSGSTKTLSSGHTLVCTDCQLVDVTKVIDGDTLDTSVGRVRFFGIDTLKEVIVALRKQLISPALLLGIKCALK